MSSSLHDYVINIKSFQTYLQHIVTSVDNGRYNEDRIKELSELITLYYKKVNENDDTEDDIEFVDHDSDISTKTNDNSDSDSDSSSSSDTDINSLFLGNNFVPQKQTNCETDKYMTEFINETIDNSCIKLYNDNSQCQERLKLFLSQSNQY